MRRYFEGYAFLIAFALCIPAANWLIGPADLNLSGSIFFIAMLSLLTSLHDRWLPVRATRDTAAAAQVEG